MRNNFTPEQLADPQMAQAAGAVRTCVHCGICTASCPTYVLLGDERDGPRGRIVQMQKMLEPGGTVSAQTVHHIDRCLSCLNCRSACPSAVDYQRLVDMARIHVEKHYRRPLIDRLLRWAIANVMTRPKLVALGLLAAPFGTWLPGRLGAMARAGAAARPSRIASVSPVIDKPVQRIALMGGCVQAAMAPQIDEAVARVLARRGIELMPLEGAGCCGALPHHLGRDEDARQWAKRAIQAYEAGRYDGVLISATGCSAHLKDYAHLFLGDVAWEMRARAFAAASVDFLEIASPLKQTQTVLPLARVSALEGEMLVAGPRASEGRGGENLRVAYHPACSMTNSLRLGGLGEKLLAASGFTLVPFAESHLCCGSAGSYSILQPELSGQLRDRKLAHLAAAEPDLVVAGNIGCLQQLGGGVPVLHLAQLLDWAEGGPITLPAAVEMARKSR
jgi:glycolate oxidase iron-sulfur subunit